MRVRLFSDIGHIMTKKIGKSRRTLKRACTLLELKHMTTYERVKPATAGPVANIYLELKMLCLFCFALESEKMTMMSGLQWCLNNDSIFPFLFFFLYFYLHSQFYC